MFTLRLFLRAKAHIFILLLRGAEAPLFHVTAGILMSPPAFDIFSALGSDGAGPHGHSLVAVQ
jgi:hypothetical protein